MAGTTSPTREHTRIYGGMLLACASFSLLLATHHPSGRPHPPAEAMRALASQAAVIEWVHGGLLALFAIQLIGYYGLARALGIHRPLAAGGSILMGLGGAAMMAAGAINGFAVPGLGASYANLNPADTSAVVAALRLCWALNQALASTGAVAMGGAMLLWSIVLTGRAGWSRVAGIAGIAAGSAIVVGLTSGLLRLDVSGFILFMALLSAWTAAAALLMLTGRLEEPVTQEGG